MHPARDRNTTKDWVGGAGVMRRPKQDGRRGPLPVSTDSAPSRSYCLASCVNASHIASPNLNRQINKVKRPFIRNAQTSRAQYQRTHARTRPHPSPPPPTLRLIVDRFFWRIRILWWRGGGVWSRGGGSPLPRFSSTHTQLEVCVCNTFSEDELKWTPHPTWRT